MSSSKIVVRGWSWPGVSAHFHRACRTLPESSWPTDLCFLRALRRRYLPCLPRSSPSSERLLARLYLETTHLASSRVGPTALCACFWMRWLVACLRNPALLAHRRFARILSERSD